MHSPARMTRHPTRRMPRISTASHPPLHALHSPVERYVSSYFSKVRCCKNSTPCFMDKRDRFVADLVQLAGWKRWPSITPVRQCLHFDEYARALAAVHGLGRAKALNEHFIPQHLQQCAQPPMVPLLLVDVSELHPILSRLRGFGFFPVAPTPIHSHATAREEVLPPHSLAIIRKLSAPEYEFIGSKGVAIRN